VKWIIFALLVTVFKGRDLSEPVTDLFFDQDAQHLFEEVPDNCAKGWIMRKELLAKILMTSDQMCKKFPEDNGEISCEYFFTTEDFVKKFNSVSPDIYTKAIADELDKFPESSAMALRTPRMHIANKINEQQPCLDLIHMQAEEVLNLLKGQLESHLSSFTSRTVTVELVEFYDGAPRNYISTKMPDEDTLLAFHCLKMSKMLPQELQGIVGEYSATPCFYKHVQDSAKSLVIYENVGLRSITQANQFAIHIDE